MAVAPGTRTKLIGARAGGAEAPRVTMTDPMISTAAAAVSQLARSSPTAHASARATTGFTKAYVPTACDDVTRSSQV